MKWAKRGEVLSRVVGELLVDDTAFCDVKGDAAAGIEPSPFDNPARCLLDAHQDNLLKKKLADVTPMKLVGPTHQHKWGTMTTDNRPCL